MTSAKASITSMKAFVNDFEEVTSMEAFVEAFVEDPVGASIPFVLSTEASINTSVLLLLKLP